MGGEDPRSFKADTMQTIPVTRSGRLSSWYGVDAGFTYGGKDGTDVVLLEEGDELATGLIDSGTHTIKLPQKSIEAYMSAIGADVAPPDSESEYWSISRKDLLKLQPLTLHFHNVEGNKVSFKLPVEAQVFPPVVTENDGLSKDRLYLTIKEIEKERKNFGFIIGQPVCTSSFFDAVGWILSRTHSHVSLFCV